MMMQIIAGHYRGHRLKAPKGPQTRPTASRLREALFNICQNRIDGSRFLDLFAGSGAMGFEALSRGAHSAAFIDAHKEAIQCIEANAATLQVQSQIQVFRGEAIATLARLEKEGEAFDIIYADPPYQTRDPRTSMVYSEQIIHWVDTHGLLRPDGVLFIEEDFRFQPHMDQLTSLVLKDSRRFGQAALQQYRKKNGQEMDSK